MAIELPDSFDVRGVVKLLASIFGLTRANIRARLVRAVGERAVGILEKSGDIFPLLLSEGPAGIWHLIVKEVGDVKDLIVEKAKSFVVERIIHAGIEFLIGLLNPVAAFIKACKMIYEIVMFFVDNIERIAQFVNTVLDSVSDIARGAIGAVSEKVESALAQMVPILIGFLARVLGIGGIGEKIRQIVTALQKPVTKAIDAVIAAGLKVAAPLIRGVKGIGKKVKAKVEQGKAYVAGKAADVKAKIRGGDDSPEGRQRRLEQGVRSGVTAVNKYAGRAVGSRLLTPVLGAVRVRHGLSVLEPVRSGSHWAVHGVISRMTEPTKTEVEVDAERLSEALNLRQLASREWTDTKSALKPLSRRLADPKSTLGPAERALARAAATSFAELDTAYVAKRDRLDAIRKSKKAEPKEIDEIVSFFREAPGKFAAIRRDIDLAAADPKKIEDEARKLRGEIQGQMTKAEDEYLYPRDDDLKDVREDVRRHVLDNPVQKDLAARIETRRKVIADGLAKLPDRITTVADLQTLRTIKEAANGLQNDALEAYQEETLLADYETTSDPRRCNFRSPFSKFRLVPKTTPDRTGRGTCRKDRKDLHADEAERGEDRRRFLGGCGRTCRGPQR